MPTPPRLDRLFRPSLPFLLLVGLLCTLWIAGGASRDNVPGQVVVRVAAILALVITILFGGRPSPRGMGGVIALLMAAVVLALLQLIPLPPEIWLALPSRSAFVEAAAASGQSQPWRPWAIVPGAAGNAVASLLIPAATLLLFLQLRADERRWLPGVLLSLIAASTIAGLLQFSGVASSNPLIDNPVGQVSGTFANRNHFALFLALGCLLAPAWAFLGGRRPAWRGPVALALVLLFVMMILASGSRAGLVLGVAALALGLGMASQGIKRALNRYPRWAFPALIAGIVIVIIAFVLVSVVADRAVSINRVIAVDPGQDMRGRGLPTVLAMIWAYFPVGSGLGGFDPIFRMHEPISLLGLTYFNHAHNDWLEVVLDAGLPGLLLLFSAVLWWGWASICAWRAGADTRYILPKLGSAALLLVMIASIFDYPARVPMIMAVIVIAAAWLGGRGDKYSA